MRISKDCFDIVRESIKEVLLLGSQDPKKLLTEHDLQAWIFRDLVTKLDIADTKSNLGVHCQTRFLDSNRLLQIEPDIAIFNSDEYTIEADGALTKRKGYTLWGSAILVELKLVRGCRKVALLDAMFDIDKLNLIRDLHYSNPEDTCEYYPLFVLFSRPTLAEADRQRLEEYAISKEVSILLADVNQEG